MHLTIVCESCGARYRIGEERVRGPFKVRCKRCGAVIVSRGPEREADTARVVVDAAPALPADEQPVAPPDPLEAVTRREAVQSPTPSLTAARHEQSVLFSLTNIQALAAASLHAPLSGPSAAPESGLIDIRALARSASAAREVDAGADVAGVPMTFTPPVLVPLAAPRSPALLTVVVALGSALTLALLTLAVVLLMRPGQPSSPAAPGAPPARSVEPPSRAPVSPPAPAGELAASTLPDRAAPAVESPRRAPSRQAPSRRVVRRDSKEKSRVETPVPRTPRASPGPEDPLETLIRKAVGEQRDPGLRAPKPTRPAANRTLPEELTKDQIVAGMQAVRPRVRECYDRYRVPGAASMRLSIAPDGRVRSATVRGIFSGTPTGACVTAAVRAARFAPFRGPSNLTLSEYPFVLQ